MREILFRGKRIGENDWIEGSLVIDNIDMPMYTYKTYRICDNTLGFDDEEGFEPSYMAGIDDEVDPDTVGQYTGLKDKNGTRIFEGDILRIAKETDGNGTYFVPPLEYPARAVVKWDLCAWMWETLCEDKRYITFPEAWCHFECEVIGNIHDNPELKGDANDRQR